MACVTDLKTRKQVDLPSAYVWWVDALLNAVKGVHVPYTGEDIERELTQLVTDILAEMEKNNGPKA